MPAVAPVVSSATAAATVQTATPAGAGADVTAGLIAVALAGVHLFGGRLRRLDGVPRSRFLSASAGVSVAYVLVHVLPELARASRQAERRVAVLAGVEDGIYLVALLGFVVYYGLERFARRARTADDDSDVTLGRVFWFHVGSFAFYNALVGYLLFHPSAPGVESLLLFGVAMTLHFFVNDHGLRDHHDESYRQVGRWVLAGGVLAGAVAGFATSLDEAVLGGAFAFIAGGVVINVVKEELPPERESRFWAFAVGAGGYGGLLLVA